MLRPCRTLALAALLLAPTLVRAQAPADPSGHWEGSINVPDNPVPVVIDIVRNSRGAWAGTFTNPRSDVKGLPLGGVAVDGKSVHLVLKVPSEGGAFDGVLSDDGKSITGKYNTDQGGYSIPFALTRTGEPKIEAAPKNPAVGKELEGVWKGTLTVMGVDKHFVLTLANQTDGTSAATFVNVDGAGIEIPIGVTQSGTNVALTMKVVSASFAGTLNAGAGEITGTWSQAGLSLPLTFRRSP